MHSHSGILGEFREFFCHVCNKTVQKWFLRFEPVRSFLATPCPICSRPAFLSTEEGSYTTQSKA